MEKKTSMFILDDKPINLVMNKWGIHPLIIGILAAIIPMLFLGILAFNLGELRSHGSTIGYLEDYTMFANFLIGSVPVVTFYFLTPFYIQQCSERLFANKVLLPKANNNKAKTEMLNSFLSAMKQSLSNKWWTVAGWVFSIIATIAAIPTFLNSRHWIAKYSISLTAEILIWLVLFAVTAILILRITIGIWWINKAFKVFDISVRILYPDKVGGLQPLSRFSLQLGFMIFFFGLELGFNQFFTSHKLTGVIGQVTWPPEVVATWIIYAALSPLAFFAPIGAAHDAMLEAKHNQILLISSSFEKEYQAFRKNIQKPIESLQKHSAKMAELQKMYAVADVFPVWPFQIQKLAQFLATIISPLVLTILSSIVTAWLSNMWKP